MAPQQVPPGMLLAHTGHHESMKVQLLAVNWSLTPFALICVLLRLWTRSRMSGEQKLGWDDALIAAAMLASITHASMLTWAMSHTGFGHHPWDVNPAILTPTALSVLIGLDTVYLTVVFLIKLSILFTYKRLFGIYNWTRRLIWIGFVIVTITAIVGIIISGHRTAKCADPSVLTIPICRRKTVIRALLAFAVCGTATDFYTLSIPVWRTAKMQMNGRKKLGLLAIFLGGLFACAMGLVHVVIIAQGLNSTDKDPYLGASRITVFTIPEFNVAIICSCIIFLPALLESLPCVGPRRFAFTSNNKSGMSHSATATDTITHPARKFDKGGFKDHDLELASVDDSYQRLVDQPHVRS